MNGPDSTMTAIVCHAPEGLSRREGRAAASPGRARW